MTLRSCVYLQAGEVMQAPCDAGEGGTGLEAQAVQQVEAGQAGAALHQALYTLTPVLPTLITMD